MGMPACVSARSKTQRTDTRACGCRRMRVSESKCKLSVSNSAPCGFLTLAGTRSANRKYKSKYEQVPQRHQTKITTVSDEYVHTTSGHHTRTYRGHVDVSEGHLQQLTPRDVVHLLGHLKDPVQPRQHQQRLQRDTRDVSVNGCHVGAKFGTSSLKLNAWSKPEHLKPPTTLECAEK